MLEVVNVQENCPIYSNYACLVLLFLFLCDYIGKCFLRVDSEGALPETRQVFLGTELDCGAFSRTLLANALGDVGICSFVESEGTFTSCELF